MRLLNIVKDKDTKQLGIVTSTKYKTFDEELNREGEIKKGAKIRFFDSMLVSQYNEESLDELEVMGILEHIKYIPYYLLLVTINLLLTFYKKGKERINGYKSRKRDDARSETRRDVKNSNRVREYSKATSYGSRRPSRTERE